MTCECRKLNTPRQADGSYIMCDDCVRFEIARLDAHYNDGRTGFICEKCGAPAWEPQGGTVCAECLEKTP